ncbi:MAG: SsrA-binding protein SmpB [Coxiellaceae bacterium]|nr:SsrA-binding protein SmpB [Coxiellaceae bacterium]
MSKQSKNSKKAKTERIIADNRKARHDFFIEQKFEAGLVLEGWEVKSLRDGRAQLKESYVILKHGEAWLIGAHFSPLKTASTHITPDPIRTRKLLLHERELDKLQAAVSRKGYTVVPVNLHWTRNRVKLEIGLAKGKQQHDKRESSKQADWAREKGRLLKRG